MKGISVIIPTLNRTDFTIDTINFLIVQKCDFLFEIIVVDQSNIIDEKVKLLCSKYDFIHYYYIENFRGLPEARNFGWQQSAFDYILYVDDDITCEDNLLSEHYKFLENPNIGIVAGGITEKFKFNTNCEIGSFNDWTATPFRGFHLKAQKEVIHGGGGNFSAKKEILKKVNGIDEHLTKGAALFEETDFCLRVKQLGYQVFYNSEAHVYHLAAETGGCRVPDINKYIYSLVRNRSFIITRRLKWYHKITAHMYLLKLVLAYAVSYKNIGLFKQYLKARIEGAKAGYENVKLSYYEK